MKKYLWVFATGLALCASPHVKALADYLSPDPTPAQPASMTSTTPQSTTTPSTPAPPAVTVGIDDAGWTWNGMAQYTSPYFYKKTGYAGGPGSYGVYKFHGTGIEVTGMEAPSITLDNTPHTMGSIQVFIDGKQVATKNLNSSQVVNRGTVIKIDGLDVADHLLHIQPMGGWIAVNYITVLNTPPPPASVANADDLSSTTYRLVPRHAPTMCLDVAPGAAYGAALDINAQNPARLQLWNIKALGNGAYAIVPAGYPELAVSITPATTTTFTAVYLWKYTGLASQQLTISPIGDGYYQIWAQTKDAMLDAAYANGTAGTQVIGWHLKTTDNYNQEWSLQAASK